MNKFIVFVGVIFLLALFVAFTRNTAAEYNHCMIVETEKSICESLK